MTMYKAKYLSYCVALAAVFVLAGCGGGGDEQPKPQPGTDNPNSPPPGDAPQIDYVAIPDDFPGDFPIYNGFRAMNAVTAKEEKMVNIMGQVADSVSDVVEWYKVEMPRNGWTEESVVDAAGQMSNLNYSKDGRMANISVTGSEDATVLNLTVKEE
jgi:hypothetical protein